MSADRDHRRRKGKEKGPRTERPNRGCRKTESQLCPCKTYRGSRQGIRRGAGRVLRELPRVEREAIPHSGCAGSERSGKTHSRWNTGSQKEVSRTLRPQSAFAKTPKKYGS